MRCCERFIEPQSKAGVAAGWMFPAAMLLLIPKCPLCLIGYAAIFGVGMSVSTASYTRSFLIAGCVGLLIFAGIRLLRSLRTNG